MPIDHEHRMTVAVEYLPGEECRATCGAHEEPWSWTGPAGEVDQAIREHVGDSIEEASKCC